MKHRIGIIGAGIGGLSCAATLEAAGADVTVFDKGRGPGGRMSTRRLETDDGVVQFDHGCPGFRVSGAFETWIRSTAAEAGWVAEWEAITPDGEPMPRWVGLPKMSALVGHMAGALKSTVQFDHQVDAIKTNNERYQLQIDGQDVGDFDAVLINAPSPQARQLLGSVAPILAAGAAERTMTPCWTALITLKQSLGVDWTWDQRADEAVDGIAVAVNDSAKPGRPNSSDQSGGPECWVVQATPAWSRAHLELDREAVAARLVDAFKRRVDRDLDLQSAKAHRWRYAHVAPMTDAIDTDPAGGAGDCLWDPTLRLGVCGDWCGPRGGVGSAWQSGKSLAARVLKT